MKPLVELTLKVAQRTVGVRESPIGSNKGVEVDKYLASVGLSPGNSWCAAYTYWCIEQAAKHLDTPNPYFRTGYCPTIMREADDARILYSSPVIGDAFLVVSGGRAHHTGFVSGLTVPGQFSTTEANTNGGGSSEGIGVFERSRFLHGPYQFVRWGDLIEEAIPTPAYDLYLGEVYITSMPLRNGRALCSVRQWAHALGFQLEWNNDLQTISLDGKPVPVQISLISGAAYAPCRELISAAGLQAKVEGRKVIVSR